jgi:hypothetical protein
MKSIFAVFMLLASLSAFAQEEPSEEARAAAQVLAKSGSFATCKVETYDVEDAVKAISQLYIGKFTVEIILTDRDTVTRNSATSQRVCLILTAR